MLSSAGDALIIMADPMRLLFLFGGVVIGLTLGVIPGLGGLVGMALHDTGCPIRRAGNNWIGGDHP
jgi:TctA family transporter